MLSGDEFYPDEVTSGLEDAMVFNLPDGVTSDDIDRDADPDDCTHDHVEPDDDGLSRRFFVCLDCDAEVRYSGPDEDGHVEWEIVE